MERKCKKQGCEGLVPVGQDIDSRVARRLGMCLYCYKGEFGYLTKPSRKRHLLPDRHEGIVLAKPDNDSDDPENASLEWFMMGFDR